MEVGALIDYRLKLYGVGFDWQTLISRWEPPGCFVDEQLRGPYRSWVHTHTFREEDGGTMVEDEVCYRLPLWPLGAMAQPAVHRQLQRIFAFRQEAIRKILLNPSANE